MKTETVFIRRFFSSNLVSAFGAFALGIIFSGMLASGAHAQSATWDGETDSVWSTGSNWGGRSGYCSRHGRHSDLRYTGNGNTTIDLGTGVTIDHILFNNAGTASYTLGDGAVGSDTLIFDNDGGIDTNSALNADQTIAADIILGDGSSNVFRIDTESTTHRIIITGDIDTGTGGVAGEQRFDIGDLGGTSGGRTVQIDGDINETGDATHIRLFVGGADLEMNGNVNGGGNTQQTVIRNDATATVNAGANLGQGRMQLLDGTLKINTNVQQFDNQLELGHGSLGNGNAAANIGPSNTLIQNSNILYLADDGTANLGSIEGGRLQITGANRTVIVNNNTNGSLANSINPELTISSTLTNDGSDRNLIVRNTGGGTLRLAPTGTANSFGGVIVQEGTLQLGAGGLASDGDFLLITAHNNAATAAGTVATVDLMGSTHALGNGTGTAGVGGNIALGGATTGNIQGSNGFQANLISTGGGGALTNVHAITYYAGEVGALNGAATISVGSITYDTSGATKFINIGDGSAASDVTVYSALNTVTATHDFAFFGEGTLAFNGSLGRSDTVGDHDYTSFNNQKTILGNGAGSNIGGQRNVVVAQRNAANFSNFDVELDLNGENLVLRDTLQIGGNTQNFGGTGVISHITITDSSGGAGRITMKGSVDGNRVISYQAGTGGTNLQATIEPDIKFDGGHGVFAVYDGASAIDLVVNGTITDDGGGNRNVVKNGDGTLRLAATDNVYNALYIDRGTVQINGVGSLGDNVVKIGSATANGILENYGAGGTFNQQFRFGANSATATGEGSILNNGTGALNLTASTFNEAWSADNDRTLTLGGSYTGADNVISGSIVDNVGVGGSVSVTKTGASTWVLAGANTYSGDTTVLGGTLGGKGTTGGGTLTLTDATISPGNSIGTMMAGDTTWLGSISYEFEFNDDGSGSAGTNWDVLDITGMLDLTGATSVDIDLVTLIADGETQGTFTPWDSLSNHVWNGFVTATDGIIGFDANLFTFDLARLLQLTNPSSSWSVVQDGNNLNLVYTAVPEPTTTGLLGLLITGILWRRRRRQLAVS